MPAKKKADRKRARREKAAAVLTIYQASEMTTRGRRQVAAWIRQKARELERYPETLGPTFRARYLY